MKTIFEMNPNLDRKCLNFIFTKGRHNQKANFSLNDDCFQICVEIDSRKLQFLSKYYATDFNLLFWGENNIYINYPNESSSTIFFSNKCQMLLIYH